MKITITLPENIAFAGEVAKDLAPEIIKLCPLGTTIEY